jgi:hypothetical protein
MAERRASVLVLGLLLALCGCKPSWSRFESPDGTFSAALPPPLRVEAEHLEGNQRLLSLESRGNEDQGFLLQRRRPARGRRLDPAGVLEGFCSEFARARSYEITAEARGTRRDGRTAQTCSFRAQALEIRIQVVAAGQCVYTLMSMWRGPAPDVDRFLDGFRVLKDCTADNQP